MFAPATSPRTHRIPGRSTDSSPGTAPEKRPRLRFGHGRPRSRSICRGGWNSVGSGNEWIKDEHGPDRGDARPPGLLGVRLPRAGVRPGEPRPAQRPVVRARSSTTPGTTGEDRRIFSPILGMRRDLYVYLPPGYDPAVAYPLIVYLHGADIDEHAFLDPRGPALARRDDGPGRDPAERSSPAPDGTYSRARTRVVTTHSLCSSTAWAGGSRTTSSSGRWCPYLMRTCSIRPEREAHALLGISAGGFGAMGRGPEAPRLLRRRSPPWAGPLNMLYFNCPGPVLRRLRPDHLPRAHRLRPPTR